jgi:hypothetical protein
MRHDPPNVRMSTRTSMRLDTGEQKRVAERAPVRTRTRPAAHVPRPPRRNRQLIIALTLVVVAGFLLGLGVPIHP